MIERERTVRSLSITTTPGMAEIWTGLSSTIREGRRQMQWKCHCEIEMWLSRLLFAHVARQELTKYAEVAKTFETYLLSS